VGEGKDGRGGEGGGGEGGVEVGGFKKKGWSVILTWAGGLGVAWVDVGREGGAVGGGG